MDWATFGAAISVSLVGGGLISAIVAWRLGLLQLLNQRTMHEHRVEMDVWDRLQKSYETEIEQLEKVGDTEKSERRRFEYAEQQAAWRAQQGVSAIAPIEVRPEGGSTLTSDELEKLGKLLAASRPLDPAALSAQDYFLRGNSYYNAGEYQVALSAYNRSLELRPDDPAILSNRGAVLGNLGRYEEALADVNRSLELRPDDPSTLNNRSGALSHLGRYEEALADVSRAQDLRPDHPLTLNNRGITLHRLNRYEEALADYNRSLELQPNEPSTLGNRGNTLADMERYGDALADYNRSLELWPDDLVTLYNRGHVLVDLGRYEEALADYNRSLEHQPDHPAILYNLARLQSLVENFDEALRWLKRSIAGDRKCLGMASGDKDFAPLRDDPEFGPRFRALVAEDSDESPPESP